MRESRNRLTEIGKGLIFALLACTLTPAQEVTTNFMPGTDFSKFHTYKWINIEGGTHPNQIVDSQIKAAVDSQLAAKGLTKTDKDKADLYVGYQVSLDQQKTVERIRHGRWTALGNGWRDGDGH